MASGTGESHTVPDTDVARERRTPDGPPRRVDHRDPPADREPRGQHLGRLPAALELAARVAENGPLALIASKAVIRQSHEWTEAEMWQKQGAIVMPVFASSDAREGAAAFAEKRKPNWQGK